MIQDLSGSWCIKGTDGSTLVMDSLVPLMQHDLADLGSLILIQITPKECTHSFAVLVYKVLVLFVMCCIGSKFFQDSNDAHVIHPSKTVQSDKNPTLWNIL